MAPSSSMHELGGSHRAKLNTQTEITAGILWDMRFILTRLPTALLVTLMLMTVLAPWRKTSVQAASTPTLVQNVSTSTNQSENGNGFIINLPNAALANNCVILTLTYQHSSSRTVTITDNIGTNAWVAGPTTNDGTVTTTLYYVLGVKAGTQAITVTFDAPLTNFQAVASEFYNVATSAATDGSSASTPTGPTIAAGSFTPGTAGDLIYQYAISLAGESIGSASQSTGITAGTNFTLLSACQVLGAAAQYQVQASQAAINPTLTVAGGSSHFNTVAIALKSAAAGTVPPAGIRIVHKYDVLPTMPTTLQFPSSGNLLVVTFTVTTTQEKVSSVTDSQGNSYTNPLPAGSPQVFYAASAKTGPTLAYSIVASGSSGGRQDVTLYDVTGAAAAPYDTNANSNGVMASTDANITNAPDITPSTAGGLVIAMLNMGIGPPSASIGSGYVFDSVFYTGQSDGSVMTYGEGRAHIYNPNTSQLAFGYKVQNNGTLSGWYDSAVAFKAGAGAVAPSAPQNLKIVP
jgi:hypothetical protein